MFETAPFLALCVLGSLEFCTNSPPAPIQEDLHPAYIRWVGPRRDQEPLDQDERYALFRALRDAPEAPERTEHEWTMSAIVEQSGEALHARLVEDTRDRVLRLTGEFDLDGANRALRRVRRAFADHPAYSFVLEVQWATSARMGRQFALASRRLDEAATLESTAQSALPNDSRGRELFEEARIFLTWERAVFHQQRGLPELAVEHWSRGHELAEAYSSEHATPELWGQSLLKGLELAAAADGFAMGGRITGMALDDARWERLGLVTQHDLLVRAGGLRLLSERRERASGDYDAHTLLERARQPKFDRSVHPDERLRRDLLAATAALDREELEEADEILEGTPFALEESEAERSPEAEASLRPLRIRYEDLCLRRDLAWDPALAEGDLYWERAQVNLQRVLDDTRDRAPNRNFGPFHIDPYLHVLQHFVELAREMADDPGDAVLNAMLSVQACGAMARELGTIATAEEAWKLVPDEGGALVLIPGLERCFVLALDTDGAAVFELAALWSIEDARAKLEEELGRLLRSTRSPEEIPAALTTAAESLTDLLWTAELRRRVASWRRLCIVGMDSFGYLPFELLPWSANESCGERFEIGYLPSFAVGAALAARRGTRDDSLDLLVLAAPDAPPAAAGANPLAFEEAERSILTHNWGSQLRSELRFGNQARTTVLEGSSAADAARLLLVAHGDARNGVEGRFHALRLWDSAGRESSWLEPDEIARLRLPPLVSLFTCGAWRGPVLRGDDGSAHLVGGLLRSPGVQTVVAPFLDVEYRGALHAANEVERALAAGSSPAAALHQLRKGSDSTTTESVRQGLQRSLFHAVGLAFD